MPRNTRRFLISSGIALLIVGISACDRPEQAPVPQEEMVSILTEVHLAEAYVGLLHQAPGQAPEKNLDSLSYYYKRILSKHHLKPQTFDSAVQWYRFHPAQLDSVYGKVVAHLDSLQAVK